MGFSTTTTENVADAVRKAFGFSVDKFPLAGPDGMKTPMYGLFRSDSGKFVGRSAVSSQYVPHTSEDVLALVEAAGSAFGGVADVQTDFRHGHRVAVQPTGEYRRSVYGTRDNVFPRLVIDAPYGGTGSFKGTLGFYRDACSNLAMLRQVSGTTVAIRHDSNLRSKMDELIETFGTLHDKWSNLVEVIERMQSREVNLKDFLESIYGDPSELRGRAETIHRNRTEAIFRRLLRERDRTGRPQIGREFIVSGWEAFNAVQGYVQHDAPRRGKPSELARIIRASRYAKVAAAERLALAVTV